MDLLTLLKKAALLLGSGVLAYFSFWYLFGGEEAARIALISIFLHEIGHWIFFRTYGYTCKIILVPFLGAAVIPDEEGALFKLKWIQLAIVALAGPFVNIVLVLVGLALSGQSGWEKTGVALASINATLAAMNLLPLFILDGGRFAYAIFESTDERHDKIIAFLLSALSVAFAITMMLFGKLTFMHLFMVFGITRASRRDDPEAYRTPRAMTLRQAYLAVSVYVLMLLLSWWWSLTMPFWLSVYK